jgi:uncharacterized protein YfbU (UPF0304 family)
MKLTNPEKLILLMLSDIYDKVGLDEVDTKLLRAAIYSENTWALDWEMPGVVGSTAEPTPPLVKEVVDYLDMWSFMEEAYAGYDTEAKAKIESDAKPFGKHVRFPGFDGNNESELVSIVDILVDDMGRFSRFKGRDLNSHAPMRESYARMYRVFKPIRRTLTGLNGLTVQKMIEILQARRHIADGAP